MVRNPGKKQKQNPVGYIGEGKRRKGNKRRVQRREPPAVEFGGELTLVRLALIAEEQKIKLLAVIQLFSKSRDAELIGLETRWGEDTKEKKE